MFLRCLFTLVLVSMLWVTTWAGLRCPLFGIPHDVVGHPWFIATLFDAYWGFTTFFVWVCYKETMWAARLAWFVAIMLLGNIAIAAYVLAELFRSPRESAMSEILTRRHAGIGILGPLLAVAGVVVIILALPG